MGARLRRRAALSARKRNKNGKLGKARTPKPLFVSTGTLKKSFFVDGAGNDSVAVATPVPYAKYHEYGTSKMPARPVMPIDPQGNPRGYVLLGENASRVTFRDNQILSDGGEWEPLPTAGKILVRGGSGNDEQANGNRPPRRPSAWRIPGRASRISERRRLVRS